MTTGSWNPGSKCLLRGIVSTTPASVSQNECYTMVSRGKKHRRSSPSRTLLVLLFRLKDELQRLVILPHRVFVRIVHCVVCERASGETRCRGRLLGEGDSRSWLV